MATRLQETRQGLPLMTIVLSILCVLPKLMYGFLTPMQQRVVVEVGGANPSELAAALAAPDIDWSGLGWPRLLLALFIHSSWLHLLGNLAYLWVFGIPVERRLGPVSLALVFLVGGVLAHVFVALRLPQLDTSVIGASGAVSAVVGAYLGLFPRGHIGLYLPLGMYVQFTRVPALLVIGSWFSLQLVYSAIVPISGAMAWWMHLAGFALGLIFALLARAKDQLRL